MKYKKEARQGLRRECMVPVDSHEGTFDKIRTVDISQKGVGLICNYPMPVDDDIAVKVDLTPRGESVVVWGKVRWVKRIAHTGNYRIGVKFTDQILCGSRSRLSRSIKRF
jgi:hypothetical protein